MTQQGMPTLYCMVACCVNIGVGMWGSLLHGYLYSWIKIARETKICPALENNFFLKTSQDPSTNALLLHDLFCPQ